MADWFRRAYTCLALRVKLGRPFGGLLSYLYANTHPDEVVGMVLLDSMFPDELSLDYLFKPADRYKAFDAEDENESLERISHSRSSRRHSPTSARNQPSRSPTCRPSRRATT